MSLQEAGEVGTQGDLIPLDRVTDDGTTQRNIDNACSLGLPECQVGEPKSGKLAIVASAPSVAGYVEMLQNWDGEIWGINGAFMWMRHREINPTAFIGLDPEIILKDYLVAPWADEEDFLAGKTFYIASQVHPEVFEFLKGRNVQLWHCSDRLVRWPIGKVLVHGGSTCLTRAPWLACMLGWQDVHIFGGDSSFTHKTHVYGGEIPTNFCFAEVNGELFRTHKVMMAQACDMVDVVQSFPGTITIHGQGLMQAIVGQYKESGVHEWLAKQEAAELGGNRKQRRAMRAQCRR